MPFYYSVSTIYIPHTAYLSPPPALSACHASCLVLHVHVPLLLEEEGKRREERRESYSDLIIIYSIICVSILYSMKRRKFLPVKTVMAISEGTVGVPVCPLPFALAHHFHPPPPLLSSSLISLFFLSFFSICLSAHFSHHFLHCTLFLSLPPSSLLFSSLFLPFSHHPSYPSIPGWHSLPNFPSLLTTPSPFPFSPSPFPTTPFPLPGLTAVQDVVTFFPSSWAGEPGLAGLGTGGVGWDSGLVWRERMGRLRLPCPHIINKWEMTVGLEQWQWAWAGDSEIKNRRENAWHACLGSGMKNRQQHERTLPPSSCTHTPPRPHLHPLNPIHDCMKNKTYFLFNMHVHADPLILWSIWKEKALKKKDTHTHNLPFPIYTPLYPSLCPSTIWHILLKWGGQGQLGRGTAAVVMDSVYFHAFIWKHYKWPCIMHWLGQDQFNPD